MCLKCVMNFYQWSFINASGANRHDERNFKQTISHSLIEFYLFDSKFNDRSQNLDMIKEREEEIQYLFKSCDLPKCLVIYHQYKITFAKISNSLKTTIGWLISSSTPGRTINEKNSL
ncbi:CLUMA_CG003692, isoform A [Clunio marinus]|uniref:CLUMA_CG003692, isoform A n=1 Tax=Clunio marinus TaxID=568069 RepID=A0A1J1HRE6_9DIPT|nr:CLUMA_CG003692, isoform A [Clunio marinus]